MPVQTKLYTLPTFNRVGFPVHVSDITWASTVYQNATSSQEAQWFNTGGADYTDDVSLGYDVCVLEFYNVTELAYYGARNENGSCKSTFTQDCIEAIQDLAGSMCLSEVL